MRVKVKTTVIDTGQEYLLLVSKMNLKGILVHTPQMLKPNTQLMLELKLNDYAPLMIKGYVHKISQEASSKKGMVIAFVNPGDDVKQKIQSFIEVSKEASLKEGEVSSEEVSKKERWLGRKKSEGAQKSDKAKPAKDKYQDDRTMIVGDNDLPSLSLSSPDNNRELAVRTMDEESLHANAPGISGHTRHAQIDPRNPTKKISKKKIFRWSTIYRAFGFVLVLIILVLTAKPLLRFMDQKFGKKFQPQSGVSSTTEVPPNTFQSQTIVDNRAAGSLDSIQIDDQGGFLKISLLGKGNFASNKISKLTNPTRIHIELLELSNIQASPTTVVNNNPISKIDVAKSEAFVAVDILYAGSAKPNFEAKVYPNAMDIFIYR